MKKNNLKRGPKKGMKFNEIPPYYFGQILMKTRRKKGLTQKELADKMRTSVRMISYYERQMKNPMMETITKLADALGIKTEIFLNTEKKIISVGDAITNRSLQKRLNYISKLPEEKQKYLSKTIDMLLKQEGITLD